MLLDTNILLDVVFDRHPFSEAASSLVKLLQERGEAAYIFWHSVSNLYYLVSRDLGDSVAREFILEFTRFLSVAETGTEDVLYAMSLPMRDFEDAMQVAAVRACGASHIVTRNLRDYARSPIPAITPQEALDQLF